jgi:RNA polymerase sigma-54 factor
MSMQQRMVPKMSQQLRMTPQLQQAIKLLQLSRMELISMVRQEMAENPVLDEAAETYNNEFEAGLGLVEPRTAPETPQQEDARREERPEDFDWSRFIDHMSSGSGTGSMPSYDGEEGPGLEQKLSSSTSLVDHLMEQLRLSGLDEQEMFLGAIIIGNLDDSGYLSDVSLDELAEQAGTSVEAVEDVLDVIQTFDPLGVGARDLRECLLIQLERLYSDEELAQQLVAEHLGNLERKSYGKIARELGVTQEDVIDAAQLIASLEPKPGGGFEQDDARYITPDIYIYKTGDDYIAVLNEDGMPRLRISDYYRKELQRKKKEGEKDDVKEYIQDKLRGAMWLIRSIHQRQSTIMRVTESIIKFQRDFFDRGVEHLKPLVLRDVAEDIRMHESTVSRVTTNKYVHTPRGIFELKYFFNSKIGTHTSGDDDVASEAVRAKIKEIISSEDPRRPLSDAKIVDMLTKDNIDIARRTVAKYREMMGILSSAQRKQMF